jgi:hypothetical protein
MSSALRTATESSFAETGVCDLTQLTVNLSPFPHVVHSEFITPAIYRQLIDSFPTCPPSTGPTGFSLFWGDEGYTRLLETEPAWRALFTTFQSQRFIDWGLQQFAAARGQADCKLGLSAAHYVSYCEDRIDKERARIRNVEHEPHELWVRMDIHQAQMGYDRVVHVDHARRFLTMLIYMCDHTENAMVGGELFLHEGAQPGGATRITPRHNLMVAFPCTARSYHSVAPLTSMTAPRNYVQVQISSSVDIWSREAASSPWRMRLRSLKRKFS